LVSSTLGELDINIINVQMSEPQENGRIILTFNTYIPYGLLDKDIMNKLNTVEGVYKVSME
jgi:predicted regulator of amino acid metabolism with ACT domain